MHKELLWVQREGPAKEFRHHQVGFLTRRQNSETESTEQVEDIPGRRVGECAINREECGQSPGGSDREEQV